MDELAIRPERPEDHDAIAQVVEAAFRSPVEARLVDAIRASPYYLPELSLVATVGDRVVGHVMVSQTTIRDGEDERLIAMLSPLAVAPGHQGEGIGSALVRAAVAETDARGEPVLILEGSPAFYGRLGFEHALPLGIHIDLPSWAPPEAAQVLRLTKYDPSVRGLVVYPPAFDEAEDEAHQEEHGMHAVVVRVNIDPSRGDEAVKTLHDFVVPIAKRTKGFTGGYWCRSEDGTKGLSVEVFASEADARAFAADLSTPPGAPATIESFEVMEVTASA
jgi:putative acetyltransferase